MVVAFVVVVVDRFSLFRSPRQQQRRPARRHFCGFIAPVSRLRYFTFLSMSSIVRLFHNFVAWFHGFVRLFQKCLLVGSSLFKSMISCVRFEGFICSITFLSHDSLLSLIFARSTIRSVFPSVVRSTTPLVSVISFVP